MRLDMLIIQCLDYWIDICEITPNMIKQTLLKFKNKLYNKCILIAIIYGAKSVITDLISIGMSIMNFNPSW